MTDIPKFLKLSPLVKNMERYSPSKTNKPIDLKLSTNEGVAPPARVMNSLASMDTEQLCRYPSSKHLEAHFAGQFNIDPARVLVTAGGDDALERALKCVLSPGQELILPVPTFEMLGRYAYFAQGTVKTLPWLEGGYPVDDVLALKNENTSAIMVVTPNSPTGLIATQSQIQRLSDEAPDVLILVDLAYIDFADDDITDFVLGLPNVVAFRTLSKAWGMAGARIGWAMGPESVIDWMRAAGNPYTVSALSLFLAEQRLTGNEPEKVDFINQVKSERKRIVPFLNNLGAKVLPTQGNFVMVSFSNTHQVHDELAEWGIGVRIFPGIQYLDNAMRVSMPGNEQNFERLCTAFEEIVKKIGA